MRRPLCRLRFGFLALAFAVLAASGRSEEPNPTPNPGGSDLDGDGNADLLFRGTDGSVRLWLMGKPVPAQAIPAPAVRFYKEESGQVYASGLLPPGLAVSRLAVAVTSASTGNSFDVQGVGSLSGASFAAVFTPVNGAAPANFTADLRFVDPAENFGPPTSVSYAFANNPPVGGSANLSPAPPRLASLRFDDASLTGAKTGTFDGQPVSFTKNSAVTVRVDVSTTFGIIDSVTVTGGKAPVTVATGDLGSSSGTFILPAEAPEEGSFVFSAAAVARNGALTEEGWLPDSQVQRLRVDRQPAAIEFAAPAKLQTENWDALLLNGLSEEGAEAVRNDAWLNRTVYARDAFVLKGNATDVGSSVAKLSYTIKEQGAPAADPPLRGGEIPFAPSPDPAHPAQADFESGAVTQGLPDKRYVVKLEAEDSAGNVGAAEFAVEVKTTAPELSALAGNHWVLEPADGGVGTVKPGPLAGVGTRRGGGTLPDDTVRVWENGVSLLRAWRGGPWVLGAPRPLSEGGTSGVLELEGLSGQRSSRTYLAKHENAGAGTYIDECFGGRRRWWTYEDGTRQWEQLHALEVQGTKYVALEGDQLTGNEKVNSIEILDQELRTEYEDGPRWLAGRARVLGVTLSGRTYVELPPGWSESRTHAYAVTGAFPYLLKTGVEVGRVVYRMTEGYPNPFPPPDNYINPMPGGGTEDASNSNAFTLLGSGAFPPDRTPGTATTESLSGTVELKPSSAADSLVAGLQPLFAAASSGWSRRTKQVDADDPDEEHNWYVSNGASYYALPLPRAFTLFKFTPDALLAQRQTTVRIRGYFGSNLKPGDPAAVSFAANGGQGQILIVPAGGGAPALTGRGKLLLEDLFNSSVDQTVEVLVQTTADALGTFDATVGGFELKKVVNIIKTEFVNLNGDPIDMINPLGENVVDDAIAFEQGSAQNDPIISYRSNPIFLQVELPAAFDPENAEIIYAMATSRETGETIQLSLTEQATPFVFKDLDGHLTITLEHTGKLSGLADNPEQLNALRADILDLQAVSDLFGKPFKGRIGVFETGLDTRIFRNLSIAGTLTLSNPNGDGWNATLTGKKEGVSFGPLSLHGDAAGVFVDADATATVTILPTSDSGSLGDITAGAKNKLFARLTYASGNTNIDGVLFAAETGVDSLVFASRVPEDGISFVGRASGQLGAPIARTLPQLDETIRRDKAYLVRITNMLEMPPNPTFTLNSLDPQGNVKEATTVKLIADPLMAHRFVSDKPIVAVDGSKGGSLGGRYSDGYYLVSASRNQALFQEVEKTVPALESVIFLGDSLGAGMQSAHLFANIEKKGFTALLARAFGWKYKSPEFKSDGKEQWGWPSSSFLIRNDEPQKPVSGEESWGYIELEKVNQTTTLDSGFTTGERTNQKINNFSVPGFEIQNLRVTTNARKSFFKGENPPPQSQAGSWGYRLDTMNEKILGWKSPIAEIASAPALPQIVVVSIGGNDLLEAITAEPTGDPDGPSRQDADGLDPDPNHVVWDAKKTDFLINGRPVSDKYPGLKFGEYVTRPTIYEAELRRILDDLESAYAKSKKFGMIAVEKNKPIILLNKVPDVTRIAVLLRINDNSVPYPQIVGTLPFTISFPSNYGQSRLLEGIEHFVAGPGKPGETFTKARVSVFTLLKLALTGKNCEFDGLFSLNPLGKSKRSVLNGHDFLKPVGIPPEYVLSDQEMDFMAARQAAFNGIIDKVVGENSSGSSWKHIRIASVDVDAAFNVPADSTLKSGPNGGIFSLDLIHPSSQGYKLIANEYIKVVNQLISQDKFFGITKTLQADLYKLPGQP